MSKLKLTLAAGRYDRLAGLADGTVQPDGIDLNFLAMSPEEMFFRMMRHREFDVSEMSMSSYVVSLTWDEPPFIAIPVFPSRFFRHSGIYISNRSGIREPKDLIGKRVGAPEYQLSAPVWIRGILSDEFGVDVRSIRHFTGGIEAPGRKEKIRIDLPADISVTPIGQEQTLAKMLVDGEIDALVSPRAPSTFFSRPDAVTRLFPDFGAAERDYFRRTRIFPMMHTVVMRRDIYNGNRWIAQSLQKAFAASQKLIYDQLGDAPALPVMLPWLMSHVEETRREMGDQWWPYGLAPNRHALETFLRYHHEQGLSRRLVSVEELFAPETLEVATV